jgi:eukaryotic-like serine/threonine-protein kinase
MSALEPRASDWAELAPQLDHLLTLPPLERTRHLEQIAANDAVLGARLSRLMEQHEAASREGFLSGVAEPRWVAPPLSASMSLGAWTLDEPLGEGGMGSVWRARRSDGRFDGEAAVKVLKNGLFDAASRERFRREGAILARLKHPGIAQLYDAGITDGGLPYLVLELVRGERIDSYCDVRRLPPQARIELLLQVLDAVAAAHAQLVIHRDLKPSNILVDEGGRARLLDFGIAHLLPGSDGAQTALTREGAFALTPQYAAPEQASEEALSAATDVYALGVVLYELLTGMHPSGLGKAGPL